MTLLTRATSEDERGRRADIAVLPIGSFEQHGPFLPLITDTAIACIIAKEIARTYPVLVLPPVAISCSHEHSYWPGTVSITASTLYTLVDDIAGSLRRSGILRLVILNAHGGNYVLKNYVQEANEQGKHATLFPSSSDWGRARSAAQLVTSGNSDMHAGELETSVLLYGASDLVHDGYETADWTADDREHLLTLGMRGYTTSGVIGRPSLASPEKGKAVLDSLVTSFGDHLRLLHNHR